MMKFFLSLFLMALLGSLGSCANYEEFKKLSQETPIPTLVFKKPFNDVWIAVTEVMKKYDLEVQNQETGTIKTKWIDNTLELNFTDSFNTMDSVKNAKFKLILKAQRGHRGNKNATKVMIYKRQKIEKDFLQGYRIIDSDLILEKTILYRIGRLLLIDHELKKLEEERRKKTRESL